MKRFLLPHLICPACLPKEYRLDPTVESEIADDIITGQLSCPHCRRRFPVRDGLATLLPEPESGPFGGQWRYEEEGMVERYLWSHYAELSGERANGDANEAWSAALGANGDSALDAGCAVGRLTFAMANRCNWAVGCDLSHKFIKTARRLARERQLTFSLPLEGTLRQEFRITLPADWRSDNIEFIVADALRLPFARETFSQSASVNLLDRVAFPLAHLFEMNRVARKREAEFLFASPFAWAGSAAPEELWLGGKGSGEYCGRGAENVRALLEGRKGIISPPWQITASGSVPWLMRTHCNHHELINSHYLRAAR